MSERGKRLTYVRHTQRRVHQISLVAFVLATTRSGAMVTRATDDLHVTELPVAMDALLLDNMTERSASDEWLEVSDIVISVPVFQK